MIIFSWIYYQVYLAYFVTIFHQSFLFQLMEIIKISNFDKIIVFYVYINFAVMLIRYMWCVERWKPSCFSVSVSLSCVPLSFISVFIFSCDEQLYNYCLLFVCLLQMSTKILITALLVLRYLFCIFVDVWWW